MEHVINDISYIIFWNETYSMSRNHNYYYYYYYVKRQFRYINYIRYAANKTALY